MSRRYIVGMPQRPKYFHFAAIMFLIGMGPSCLAQTPPPAKKLPVGPPAPQSTHYPILLLAFGNDPNWSLRIGQKGPERFDRAGYPPITLEPADVTHEATAGSWTYHAKDSATGAAVAVHLTREPCTDAINDTLTTTPPVGGKYAFRASVDHAQIGSLKGCARIAAELFPKITNPASQNEDEDDTDKQKPPVSTITNSKLPAATAYLNAAGRVVFKRGAIAHVIAAQSDQLAVSHDGKRLLYTREDTAENRAIFLYDFATEKSTELVRGGVQQPFWSPDDTQFAFLKFVDGKWHLWSAPIASPESATSVYPGEVIVIHGWADAHTILVDDLQQLFWVNDDRNNPTNALLERFLGDSFGSSSANTVRIHPLNPDLLLVSAEWLKPPQGVPIDARTGSSLGFFLYEIRSKRRVLLSPLNMFSQYGEWSRDGLQIFFTGTDSSKRSATYRIFWDGTGLQKYSPGTHLVIGQ